MQWKLLGELFRSWFKIGLFTFGGGYAMLPMIEKEIIDKKGWVKQEEIIDIFAMAQSIPGALAINSAIFVGHQLAGFFGAIAAAIGVVLPSLLIILLIAIYFMTLMNNRWVMATFTGIRAAIAGLVSAAALRIARSSCRSAVAIILAAISVVINSFTEIHSVWIIILGAISGIVIYYLIPKFRNEQSGRKEQS